ncbi:hypothetical protein LVJ83_11160 [Uruburuella testudinis]|uniref:Lipoprotein n=1 Tax=Uruburuella testudinis TaxID=1282863 RepID=A0ABY4DR10_9NEIS|nr:hypothetical protein [Uruburuella testudinis]UOO81485.1 hypothetical protein LVJ83_11160 [Uruburuella testudinis]
MKANFKAILPAALLLAALTGCSTLGGDKAKAEPAATAAAAETAAAQQTPATMQVDSIDGRKEVAYKCGEKGQNPLTVMYGFKDNQVVVAQVKFQDKLSPGLFRVIGDNDQNSFTANGITWATDKATPATVDKVDGNMLTQQAVETVNGQQQQVSQIVTKYCKLDKAATAKLAKAAK